jgi:hypothetical protein
MFRRFAAFIVLLNILAPLAQALAESRTPSANLPNPPLNSQPPILNLSAATNAGPVSPYYLTAGDQGTNWVVQGSAVVNSFTQHHPEDTGEYAIAVTDTIRTLGTGNVALGRIPPHPGSEYTLAGTYTGIDFPYPNPSNAFFDGATDGRFNYSVDYYAGGVYRLNADWSHPVLLFATGPGYMGITFDVATNTLWLAHFYSNVVEHRSLTGAVIFSFPVADNPAALALDPADNTLWLTAFVPQGRLFQYAQNGTPLGEVSYPELVDQDTAGGEFALPALAAGKGNARGFGTINTDGESSSASFTFNVPLAVKKSKPSMSYSDPGSGISFNTKKLGPVTIMGRHAHFAGTAKLGKKAGTISFIVDMADLSVDGAADEFTLSASNGYSASGTLTSGNITVTVTQ